MLSHELELTGAESLAYVGHSQVRPAAGFPHPCSRMRTETPHAGGAASCAGARLQTVSTRAATSNPPPRQGTTVALALLSSQPEWAERIHLGVLLAPVAFATNVQSVPLIALAKLNTDQVGNGTRVPGLVWGRPSVATGSAF